MPIEKFKDITVNGRDFRVGLVSALIGDWIVSQVGLKKYGDPEVYQKVQYHLLETCSAYIEKGGARVPMKIFSNGRWLVPDLDLEYDLQAVHDICAAALEFNVGPFFKKLMAEGKTADPALPSASITTQ